MAGAARQAGTVDDARTRRDVVRLGFHRPPERFWRPGWLLRWPRSGVRRRVRRDHRSDSATLSRSRRWQGRPMPPRASILPSGWVRFAGLDPLAHLSGGSLEDQVRWVLTPSTRPEPAPASVDAAGPCPSRTWSRNGLTARLVTQFDSSLNAWAAQANPALSISDACGLICNGAERHRYCIDGQDGGLFFGNGGDG